MIQKPKGTKDLLPNESFIWQKAEAKIKKVIESFNFREIRVPVFEHTELFQRGVGETTDVVQKEMYTFDDKGGRSISLRPEGTAGVVRAYLESGLSSKPSPTKLWYNMPMYRYENVQKGRLREFHQIGAELIGSSSYLADVEIIMMANEIFRELRIPDMQLNINSIGCPKCRASYQEKLKEYVENNKEHYCDTCKTRLEKNPMRILDCKERKCKELNQKAPVMLDYLCDECKEHFEKVTDLLREAHVIFKINPKIVRGLDYYTKTVFEFVDYRSGLTVLGGGRYDGLIEQFGGVPTPAIGFAAGMERLMELYVEHNPGLREKEVQLYVLSTGEEENKKAIELCKILRENGFIIEKDTMGRSFAAQMKYANKLRTSFVLIIGEEELENNQVRIKNMINGEEMEMDIETELASIMMIIDDPEDEIM